LKLRVGVMMRDVELYELLRNRITENMRLKIVRAERGYADISCTDTSQVLLAADILADIMIEHLQMKFIARYIKNEYGFFSDREQGEVLITALKRIWFEDAERDAARVKAEVAARILRCIREEREVLSLDGVMRFRMQDFIESWKRTLRECAEKLVISAEEKEFVHLLRYFVCMRDPLIKAIVVVPGEEEYLLFDGMGVRVKVSVEGDEPVTKEDELLSRLLSLAPERIDITSVEDERLAELIRQVFVGRVT